MEILENIWIKRIILSVITIAISVILYNVLVHILEKGNKKENQILEHKKKATYIRLIKNIGRYFFIFITLAVILQIFGINITSMIAGVGILGIIVGFAIQDALKDIIKGFDIISDSYYQVGDVIKYKDVTGKVFSIGLKTTKLQDVYTLNMVSISNRNIDQVEVVSNLININIPFPYELKVNDVEKVVSEITKDIKKEEKVDDCEYRGIQELADSSIKYQIKVYCNPTDKVQVRRDCLRIVMLKLEKNNISVPYNQIDIHQK